MFQNQARIYPQRDLGYPILLKYAVLLQELIFMVFGEFCFCLVVRYF